MTRGKSVLAREHEQLAASAGLSGNLGERLSDLCVLFHQRTAGISTNGERLQPVKARVLEHRRHGL
jgi:hypothetical protein